MELILATHNQHKLEELKQMIPSYINLISLTAIDFHDEIEETGTTFKENAFIKTNTIHQITKKNVFSDDSGLVIEALNGEPGVYSARYAGTGNSIDNIHKVLEKLENVENRKAYFIAVFCLILNEEFHFFEGKVHGTISHEIKGIDGFGYDPIFIPDGYDKSFAEMSSEEKNQISHRYLATKKLNDFLTQHH